MKLIDLFLRIPILEDSGRLPEPPSNLPSFNPKFSKIVGTFDGYDIWGSRELKGYEVFGIKEKDNVVSYLIIEESDKETSKLRELWVDPKFRGKGYAISLLLFLLRKLKLRLLISHEEVLSDDARNFILRSFKSKKFKASTPTGALLSDLEVEQMFRKLGKTSDELILHEEPVRWDLFGNSTVLKEPWYARGEGLD